MDFLAGYDSGDEDDEPNMPGDGGPALPPTSETTKTSLSYGTSKTSVSPSGAETPHSPVSSPVPPFACSSAGVAWALLPLPEISSSGPSMFPIGLAAPKNSLGGAGAKRPAPGKQASAAPGKRVVTLGMLAAGQQKSLSQSKGTSGKPPGHLGSGHAASAGDGSDDDDSLYLAARGGKGKNEAKESKGKPEKATGAKSSKGLLFLKSLPPVSRGASIALAMSASGSGSKSVGKKQDVTCRGGGREESDPKPGLGGHSGIRREAGSEEDPFAKQQGLSARGPGVVSDSEAEEDDGTLSAQIRPLPLSAGGGDPASSPALGPTGDWGFFYSGVSEPSSAGAAADALLTERRIRTDGIAPLFSSARGEDSGASDSSTTLPEAHYPLPQHTTLYASSSSSDADLAGQQQQAVWTPDEQQQWQQYQDWLAWQQSQQQGCSDWQQAQTAAALRGVSQPSAGAAPGPRSHETGKGTTSSSSSTADIFELALQQEQERMRKRGGAAAAAGEGLKFKEVSAAQLTSDAPKRQAAEGLRGALGRDYENELRSSAQKFEGSKVARRKHQIGTLFHNARLQELEMLERDANKFKNKSEGKAKYGW